MLRSTCASPAWRLGLGTCLTFLTCAATALGQGGPYGGPYPPVAGYPGPGYGGGYPAYPAGPAPLGAALAPVSHAPPVQPPSVLEQPANLTYGAHEPAGSDLPYSLSLSRFANRRSDVLATPLVIDPAQVFTHFRLRLDAGRDNPTPDRAEYFWAKSGALPTADADGPPLPETQVNYFDVRGYLEAAVSRNFSYFVEVPVRFLNPEVNDDEQGLGDVNAGVKGVLLTNGEDYITLQVTAHLPTGDADQGLGTDRYAIEPGLLFHEQFSDRVSLFGEIRYWLPLDESDFAGEILRAGVGGGYDLVYNRCRTERITAVAELISWSIFDGAYFDGNHLAEGVQGASGDTIVNAQIGLRYTQGLTSFAASWGHVLTDEQWFEELARLEFRRAF